MSALLALLKRDWWITTSYRASFLFSLAQIVFSCAVFFFIGRLIDAGRTPLLAPYGGSYFTFVLLGLVFSRFLATSMASFARNLREEQLQGTLASLLLTPARLPAIVAGGSLLEIAWTAAEAAAYLAVGALFFGADLGSTDWFAAFVLLLLTLTAISSLGVLSAAGVLLFKEFNPVAVLLGGAMKLFGGVYFPVALLPGWLLPAAKIIPLTYGLEGFRQAVINGRGLGELGGHALALLLFSAVLWPAAIAALSLALRRLRQTGSLGFR